MSLRLADPDAPLRPWQAALVAVTLAAVLVATLRFHHQLVACPHALDSAEPAEAFIAKGVANGVDFGDPANIPKYSEGYGPVYMLVTGELCRLGVACDLPSQRALCALFIAGIVALVGLLCRRLDVPWLETLCAALWAYQLMLLNVTPISRPGALGALLWLAGLAVPFLLDYSAPSLVLAALLIALATFTKLYFLCAAGYLGAWLVWRRGRYAFFAAWQAAFLVLVGLWAHHWLPFLFYGSVLVHLNASPSVPAYMGWQLRQMLGSHSPGLAAAALLFPLLLRRGLARQGAEWAFYGAFGLALFILFLGGALGGRFTYFTQLAALPFLPFAAATFSRLLKPRLLALGLLLASAAWAAQGTLMPDFRGGSACAANWGAVDSLVGMSSHPFVDSDLDCSLSSRGLPIQSTGMCTWFQNATRAHGLAARLFPLAGEMDGRYQAWIAQGRAMVRDPATDLVIVSPDSQLYFKDLLDQGYVKVLKTLLPYPLTGGVTPLEVYARPALAPALAADWRRHFEDYQAAQAGGG
jgi:hypothetical protein